MPETPIPLDLDAIRARVDYRRSAADVPGLIAEVERLRAEVARLTTRPAPAWDEDAVALAVFERSHEPPFEDSEEGMREAKRFVRSLTENLPVKPDREGALKRAYRDRQSPLQEEDAWAFGEGVRAGIDAVLDLWP